MSSVSPSAEWMLLTCHACGAQMKARPEVAAHSRVLCPACHSPVNLQQHPADAAPEFRAEMRAATEKGPTSRMRPQDDFHGNVEFGPPADSPEAPAPEYDDSFLENLPHVGQYQSTRRTRRKRKRKGGSSQSVQELTDWDLRMASLPEAEIVADTWMRSAPIPEEVIAEKTREFVVSEEEQDGQMMRRVKRIRRRRIIGMAQAFFRRLSYTTRVISLIMLGFISLGGLGLAIHVLRQKFAPEPDGDTSGDFTYDRNLLGSADELGAERAVRDFLAADGVAKKLEFVRLPRRVQPLMEEYYRTRSAAPATAGEVTDREKVRSGDTWLVMLEMLVNDADPFDRSLNTPRKRNFAVEEIESNGSYLYKVDWEIAVAWEEMPLEEFRRDMPRTAVPFRVVMRESDYYNHGFLDRSRWLAADLYYPGRREFQFTGYIELGTKEGDELRSMIAGGRRTGAVLALRYPPEAVSRDQVVIERLVHDSWYYKQDVPPGQESSAIPSDGAKN